jgi:CheY-like chemotaxis protein
MLKVLLVEDDKLVQIATKAMLARLKCEVDVCSNGQEAINKLDNNDYDIFLVDIGLPDISGVEVIRKTRDKKGSDAIIVAVTGYTDDQTSKECAIAGVTEVLYKPVMMDGFKDLFERYMLI